MDGIDDATEAVFHHVGTDPAAHVPGAVEVQVDDGAPADYARNFDAVETKADFRRALLAGY